MSLVKTSFSGMKDYQNCPHKFYEVKVAKSYVTQDTPQTIYGKEIHTALENYARDGAELPKNYQGFKKWVDPILEIPGDRYPELQLGLNTNWEACEFDSSEYFLRGIIDLLVVSGDVGFLVDYKTGSAKYADMSQIKLMALMTFAHFPQVQKIKGALLFLTKNVFLPSDYKREDIPILRYSFMPTITRMEESYRNNHWPKNPTPLCGWCAVRGCEFWKSRT